MLNSFKTVRIASEICGMSRDEIKLLAELLVDNKNAEELQFQLEILFQEKNSLKETV